MSEDFLLDKTGREIMVGDTLKIFHFRGSRGKRFYMYHYVEDQERREAWDQPLLRISHLNRKKSVYYKVMDGSKLEEIEIVQGFADDGTPFEERPVIKILEQGAEGREG